jgi:hypothetical protein
MQTKDTLRLTLACLAALAVVDARAEDVTSACAWRPPAPATAAQLNSAADVEAQRDKPESMKSADGDYLVVTAKRAWFHSLPDDSCRSGLFVVRGDAVESVTLYPAQGDVRFIRAIFASPALKREVVGWMKAEDLCRGTGDGDFSHCGIAPK